jgi:hypothetical protein
MFEMKHDFVNVSVEFDWIDIIYAVYGLIWVFSIYLQYFEYKRGLPHEWYSHLMFWGLNFISQTGILIFIVIETKDLLKHKDDNAEKLQVFVTLSAMAIISLILFICGLIYKKEYRFNENRGRNYLPRGSKARVSLLRSFNEVSNSYGSRESAFYNENRSQMLINLPKLTTNVKNISLKDNDPNDLVCEIYVYKDNKLHIKLKKDYKMLQELEQFIRLKY